MPQRAVELPHSAQQRYGSRTDVNEYCERALVRLQPDFTLAVQRREDGDVVRAIPQRYDEDAQGVEGEETGCLLHPKRT